MIFKIIKNTSYLYVSKIMIKLLFFLHVIILSRYLGDSGLGQYAFLFSFTSIWFFFVDLGLTDYFTRSLGRDKKKLKKYISDFVSLKLSLSVSVLFFIVLVSFNLELQKEIILLSLSMTLNSITSVFISNFQAQHKIKEIAFILFSTNFLTVLLSVLSIVLYQSIFLVVISFLMGAILKFILVGYFSLNYISSIKLHFDISKFISLIKKSLPFIFGISSLLLVYHTDIVMLNFFINQKVGIYEAANSILKNLLFFPQVFLFSLYPAFNELYIKNKKRLNTLYKKSFGILLILNSLLVLFVLIFAELLIKFIFGIQFQDSVLFLRLLVIGTFFFWQNNINITYLNSLGKEKINAIFIIFTILLNVVLNFFFISWQGALGVIISTNISFIFLFIVSSFFVHKIKKRF